VEEHSVTDPSNQPVGIVSVGMYLPEPVLTAADIAADCGMRHQPGV
jgi:hypothetical protein